MGVKIKWRVGDIPTGPYCAFNRRSWPSAYIGKECKPVAQILCGDSYEPAMARGERKHAELKVMVACWLIEPWEWRTLKKRAVTLAEAKTLVQKFYEEHADWLPKDI